jgi:hypothetical protein
MITCRMRWIPVAGPVAGVAVAEEAGLGAGVPRAVDVVRSAFRLPQAALAATSTQASTSSAVPARPCIGRVSDSAAGGMAKAWSNGGLSANPEESAGRTVARSHVLALRIVRPADRPPAPATRCFDYPQRVPGKETATRRTDRLIVLKDGSCDRELSPTRSPSSWLPHPTRNGSSPASFASAAGAGRSGTSSTIPRDRAPQRDEAMRLLEHPALVRAVVADLAAGRSRAAPGA